VRGVARLRVIDASIMPTITSGNTASPTVMIAEKGAAAVIEDRRRGRLLAAPRMEGAAVDPAPSASESAVHRHATGMKS
jgi:choline dehydrogenase-like flavoprotein